MNCIQQGIIPTKYYENLSKIYLMQTDQDYIIHIGYKVSDPHIRNNGICFKTTFMLERNFTSKPILGNPLLYPFQKFKERVSTKILGRVQSMSANLPIFILASS
jgi:hypothetical protein